MTQPASQLSSPLTIARQGSFFVGGRQVRGAGSYNPAGLSGSADPDSLTDDGQTYWIDQMYVQFQEPAQVRGLPLVFVHGGSCTGQVWESTPDGREGFATLLLREGLPVYVVDAPRRGRSGFPSFNSRFGELSGREVVPPTTRRAGMEWTWDGWRLGPALGKFFPDTAFPARCVEDFYRGLVPMVADDAELTARCLGELLKRIGPAVLITHSVGGIAGWYTAARSPVVRAVVAFEPTAYLFAADELPRPIPLQSGPPYPAGQGVPLEEFAQLGRCPIAVIYGDKIPAEPVVKRPADVRRAQVTAARAFADAVRRRGGTAEIIDLAAAGLPGRTHFAFLDHGHTEVKRIVCDFLARHHVGPSAA